MITAVAVSLAGSIFAGRIAYRVTRDAMPRPRRSPVASPLCAARRSDLRRGGSAPARGLHALHPQRPVRSHDRHLLPGGDRHVPVRALPVGARVRGARVARPTGGLAVPGLLHGVGLAQDAVHAVAGGRRRGPDRLHVVRDSLDHQRQAQHRRRARFALAARAAREQGVRHDRPLHRAAVPAALDRGLSARSPSPSCAASGWCWSWPPRSWCEC